MDPRDPGLGPGVALMSAATRTPDADAVAARALSMIIQPENQVGGSCVFAMNSLAGVRTPG
jgi:hypothetical protein